MDVSARLARISALASIVTALYAFGIALEMQAVGTPGDFYISLPMIYMFAALGLVGGIGLYVLPALERQSAAVRRARMPWLFTCIGFNLAFASGFVHYAGGLEGPFWIVFFPILVFAGVVMSRPVAAVLSCGSAFGFVLGAWQAGTVDERTLGPLLLIAPFFPAVTLLISEATRGLERLGARARADRDELSDRISDLSTALELTAQGDLTVDPSRDLVVDESLAYADALNVLGGSLQRTLGNLRVLVNHVRSSGEALATNAGELLATAEQSAASATEQSSAVSETTSTIEELAATAAQIADTAHSVAAAAEHTLQLVDEGRSAVEASVSAMARISGRVDDIAGRALSLGEQSSEIGRILEVIDDLSDQTNLLALNAAIEAARAGEHGRGFAVVASEVRKLAERSMVATRDIQAIVASIQHGTNATILASEEGAREVRAGVDLAQGAVASLSRITGIVDETTAAAKEISIATQQQRSASDQVVSAMTQVSDVSRQYAVGSRQAAAAAAELNVLAAELRASIAQFRVA